MTKVACICISFLIAFAIASAQTTTGSIVGKVTDSSGAIVPNAAVTVTNVDTGIAIKATTDADGNYGVTTLPVGRYSVTIEAQGFKKSVSSGVTGNVQDRIG